MPAGSDCVAERHSALTEALRRGGRDGSAGLRHLRLGELRGWSLVQLAAFPDTLHEFERALRPVLSGAELPPHARAETLSAGQLVFNTGPGQFWILSPEGQDLAATCRLAIPPHLGSVTSLSHSRTRLLIEGSRAREVLSNGIAIDLHPAVFPVTGFAITGLHHTSVLLHRAGAARYELYVMRSYALWLWGWLIDAALPFGYELEDTNRSF
jgi:methylglutamate dehydrogenase subunit D